MLIKIFFPYALLIFSSPGFAAQLSDSTSCSQAIASYVVPSNGDAKPTHPKFATLPLFQNNKHNAPFIYDATTLREHVTSTSTFTRPQASLNKPRSLGEQYANFDSHKLIGTAHLPNESKSLTFYALIKGQSSPNYQDSPNQIDPGSNYASKYYPEKKIYPDLGYILNLEARIGLPKFAEGQPGPMQLIVFVDTSALTMNQYAWTDSLNHATLSGVGAGINWMYSDNFEVKGYFANKLNNDVLSLAPDLSNLYWIQAVKYF